MKITPIDAIHDYLILKTKEINNFQRLELFQFIYRHYKSYFILN